MGVPLVHNTGPIGRRDVACSKPRDGHSIRTRRYINVDHLKSPSGDKKSYIEVSPVGSNPYVVLNEKALFHSPELHDHKKKTQLTLDELAGMSASTQCMAPILFPFANRHGINDRIWHEGKGVYVNMKPDVLVKQFGYDLYRKDGIICHGPAMSSTAWERTGVQLLSGNGIQGNYSYSTKSSPIVLKRFGKTTLDVSYKIPGDSAPGEFHLDSTITNHEKIITPVTYGIHFFFETINPEQWVITSPDIESRWALNNAIPNGKFIPQAEELQTKFQFKNEVAFAEHEYDHGFKLNDSTEDAVITLTNYAAKRKIEILIPRSLYNHVVVFRKPGSPYICIEPYSSMTDGINLAKEGLKEATPLLLRPQHQTEGTIKIKSSTLA